MVNQDEEGVPYADHSGDEQRQNQQPGQQEGLNLNATANGATETDDANVDLEDVQNGQPHIPVSKNSSALDRLDPSGPAPRPLRGIGTDESRITQELRHRLALPRGGDHFPHPDIDVGTAARRKGTPPRKILMGEDENPSDVFKY
ncbi:hypothetical protein PIB30_020299 [Stylosanthes scabra]|uniref:Uncharacterized protein n=1 Tax=Stylosanthes scabra TaxID=79078 RepID=A0ABU6V8A9_9FABA|nr:hypothetical protein [Stylosanthes scabra]